METLAMFPLGTALLPHMPLALRVFEERYHVMMRRVLQTDAPEFGVVLIESGAESGGADAQRRFDHGTIARVMQVARMEDELAVIALGLRRIEVVDWLDDDPHPVATVREVPELEWDASQHDALAQLEDLVRGTLTLAGEFVDSPWSPAIELDDDPVTRAWQLGGIAPVGAIDQLGMLRARSIGDLIDAIREAVEGTAEVLASPFAADASPGDGLGGFGGPAGPDEPDDRPPPG